MNKALKLIPIGNSTGVILPRELLQSIGAAEGDRLFPVRTPTGIELRLADPEFEDEMRLAREIMRERRNVLRELAKQVGDWRWVSLAAAEAAHLEQLAEHGGGEGVRDQGLLESAMARPQNLAAYGDPDAAALAAAYASGIARNHPFIDGNKRTALVVSLLYLAKNGLRLSAGDAETLAVFLDLAAGDLSEGELAGWFRERVAPRQ